MRYAIGLALAACTALAPLPHGFGDAAAQASKLQWGGCWQLEGERADAEPTDASSRQVCVQVAGTALSVATLVDGAEVRRDELRLDGSPRDVEDGGCAGTEQAILSSDGHRLYTTASLLCEGGERRLASGISALVSPDSWIDIQVVRVGEERELMVRRFRYDEAATRLADDPTNTTDFALAARTARTAASAVVDTADIIEAASIVDAAAVEALLIETNAAFAIDGSALIALAESGVPGEVIDLMVALSFPDYFVVNGNPEASQAAPSYGAYGYPVRFFGYWTPAFSPWGWGYTHYPSYGYQGYPGYPAGGRPPSTGKRYGGKVVKGGGYARVTTSPSAPSGGFGRFIREGGSSVGSRRSGGGSQGGNKSGGTTSSSGASVGSKASKGSSRKAKRRDG